MVKEIMVLFWSYFWKFFLWLQLLTFQFWHLPEWNFCCSHFAEGSDKLYPTALHFAASFGLKNITNYLLGLPGADYAGTIRNKDNLSPAEMAKKNGHEELSDIMHVSVQLWGCRLCFTITLLWLRWYTTETCKRCEMWCFLLRGERCVKF